jgi:branched-chain amino acid transport system substrate-binding protein
VACEEGVPISTGDGTSPTLVLGAGDCAFHMLMLDTVQGAVAATQALDLGYSTAYVLGSSDDSYTAGLPVYFADAFEEGGGEVLATEEFRIGATDFNVQIADIAASDPAPDFIYTSMFTPDTPQFLRQLRAAGVTIPVISGDGSVDSSVLEAGEAAEGLLATFHAWPTEDNAIGQWLDEHFPDAEASAVPQNIVAAVGYDEVHLIKQAIEAAGEATAAGILEALPGMEFEGVTGSLTIDPDTHQATKETTLISVEGGEYVFLDSFVPDYIPTVE